MNIKALFVEENDTVLKTMQKMDDTAKGILFVTQSEKLLAAVSDGDIRRWILSGGGLDEPISKAANYNPLFLRKTDAVNPQRYMREKSIEALPIVDEKGVILSICFWDETMVRKIRKTLDIPVVMMAGGKGTRLYPYTKILPKPLIPVGELPIAEIIMDKFYEYGCNKFYLVVNHKKNMIKAYFNEISKDYQIFYADEEIPLGTGGGLSLLKGRINSTFILTNCDILIDEDFSKIYDLHVREKNVITMICSLKNYTVPYGVVEIGEHGSILDMKEKPELSFFTNTGSYIVEPEVIEDLEENEAIGFPDIIAKWKQKGYKVGVYPINEKAWMDMGQIDELKKMDERLNGKG